MPLIFTEEFLGSIKNPGSPFSDSYVSNLAFRPSLESKRDMLENIISKYPLDKRTRVIKQIQSVEDNESKATVNELLVFEILSRYFTKIEVEVPISLLGNKTPDFFVDDKIVFEVAAPFGQRDKRVAPIIEAIEEIKSDIKIMLGPIRNLPSNGEYPKIKEIKEGLIRILEQNKNITKPTQFEFITPQNICFSGSLVKGSGGNTIISVMDSCGFNGELDQYKTSIRKTIKKKMAKYKALAGHGMPIVIVLCNENDWLDPDEFQEIFFGEVDQDGHIQNKTLDHPNKNTSLSAVLIKDYTSPDTYFLVENNNAKVKLGIYKDVITKAFKAKDL